MNRDERDMGFIGLLAGLFIGAMACLIVNNHWRAQAIEAGHAEYYLDEDFNRQWRWLPVGDPGRWTKIEQKE